MLRFSVDGIGYCIGSKENELPCILRDDGQEIKNQKEILRKAFQQLGEPVGEDDERTTHELIRDLEILLKKQPCPPNEKAEKINLLNAFISDIDCLVPLYRYTSEANIFDILKVNYFEIRHSNMLAWLIDPNGNHGLEDKFLKKLLIYCVSGTNLPIMRGLRPVDIELMNLSDCVVYREKDHIDILIESEHNKLVIAIENKTESTEHSDQLNRYRTFLQNSYPSGYRFILLYLTPYGTEPSDTEHWVSADYGFIKDTLSSLIRIYPVPQKVKTYIGDYLFTIRRYIVEDKEIKDICTKIYYKHKAALDLIFENRPNIRSELSAYLIKRLTALQTEYDFTLWVNDSGLRFIRFIPNKLIPYCKNKGTGWVKDDYIFGFEIQLPETGKIILKATIGPSKDEYAADRRKLFEAASKNPKHFKTSRRNLNGKWNVIDTYTLHDHIETLAEEQEAENIDFDTLIGHKVERYLKEELPQKTEILLHAFED